MSGALSAELAILFLKYNVLSITNKKIMKG